MKQLYSGLFDSDRHWAWLAELGVYSGGSACWVGQKNGLIGTALANQISFKFGPHTSEINLNVFEYETPPRLSNIWEEVVESSLVITKRVELYLLDSDGDTYGNAMCFDMGEYRVRFCSINFGVTEDVDKFTSELDLAVLAKTEQYELSFWRQPASPDEIIRVTSPQARSWHKFREIEN